MERVTILPWKNAVTDRTQSDVERVLELLKKGWHSFTEEEKETWQKGLKGALNRSDLERIQNNVQLLSDVLELDLTIDMKVNKILSMIELQIYQMMLIILLCLLVQMIGEITMVLY